MAKPVVPRRFASVRGNIPQGHERIRIDHSGAPSPPRRSTDSGQTLSGLPRHMTHATPTHAGVARSTFYDWRAARKAPPCIKLPNGDLRIRRADFERWLESLQQA